MNRGGSQRVWLAPLGALSAAVAAFTCCVPVPAVLAGAGLAMAGAWIQGARPWLLGASLLVLIAGFVQAYRAAHCGPKKTWWRAASGIAGLITLLVVAGFTYLALPGSAPAGQPPLVKLDGSRLGDFQAQFNAASDRVRVLTLLSPT